MFGHFFRHQYRVHERFAETGRTALSYSAFFAFALRRLFPYGLSVVSLPIGKPLTDDALHGPCGSLNVIYAEPDAIAIAEIKFCEIAVQMLLAAVLIDTLHTALENRIVALNGIGMYVAADVFFLRVIHSAMLGKFRADSAVMPCGVGHKAAFPRDVLADDWNDAADRVTVNVERAGRAAALNQGQHYVFVGAALHALAVAFHLADIGFVCFYNRACAAHRGHADDAHSLTDAMRHEPCSFQSDAQSPRKLIAGNALLAGAEKVHGLKPQIHRDVAVLKDGPDLHGELLAALVALPKPNAGRFTAHLTDPLDAAAVRANRTVRPYAGLNPRDSDGFGLQNSGGKDRIGHDTYIPYMNQGYQGHMGLSSTISPFT